MTKSIIDHEGTIDKFIGDAIMAFWNAPIKVIRHKEKALLSAIDMLRKLGKINKVFIDKFGFEINIGIGLHSGIVRVGNMGTDDLFDYTIIGDNVNLASRLEGLTKYYGVRIILSETMADACPPDFKLQELDMVSVKGRDTPVTIYGLYTGHYARHPETELPLYIEGIKAYRARNFTEGLKIFSRLNSEFLDRRLYRLYEARCQSYITSPPPEDWDKVFRHISK